MTATEFLQADVDSLRQKFHQANQGHVFHYWDILNDNEKSALYTQLNRIDPSLVNALYARALDAQLTSPISPGGAEANIGNNNGELSAPPAEITNPEKAQEWSKTGMEALKNGKVAVLLLAGGQGTRLGSSSPKGCYNINLPSQKSLFQLQAERILRLGQLAGHSIRWYIMTSGPTRQETESFFEKNNYFGLDKTNLVFFEQGTLPCISNEGKILMSSPSQVAVAPDGNGGIYSALKAPLSSSTKSTVLSDMKDHGIEHIHAYCVDNALVRPADPAFMGYSIDRKALCGSKVVTKTDAKESVGVVALRGGRWMVVEYSEIPEDVAAERDDDDPSRLKYRAANIVNHYYSLEFLENVERITNKMAPHIARKKIPCIPITFENIVDPATPTPELVKPAKPNGIKLEFFIFDVLPFLEPNQHVLLEVLRENEFSPLKNAPGTGVDDPDTSRSALLDLHRRWIEDAGAKVESQVEISPLISYSGENLEQYSGKTVQGLVQ